jgi:hypothetical protein
MKEKVEKGKLVWTLNRPYVGAFFCAASVTCGQRFQGSSAFEHGLAAASL